MSKDCLLKNLEDYVVQAEEKIEDFESTIDAANHGMQILIAEIDAAKCILATCKKSSKLSGALRF